MTMPMPPEDYARNAYYLSNRDGDSIRLQLALGFGVELAGKVIALRLLGIDCPELAQPGGREAQAFAAAWFAAAPPASWPFRVQSVRWDKFGGRYLGYVWRRADGASLVDDMLAAKHGVAYNGGKR